MYIDYFYKEHMLTSTCGLFLYVNMSPAGAADKALAREIFK